MRCKQCGGTLRHIIDNIFVCRSVTCNIKGVQFGLWSDADETNHTAPTINEILVLQKRINNRDIRKLKLTNNQMLYWFIHGIFEYVDSYYLYICHLAKAKWGSEGWRKIDFEGVGLWVAIHRFAIDLEERD